MFGKIFGSVFGKFFDSIGMGWMTNVLSLAVNVMSGNWLAAAKDVFDLVAQFSDSEWMQRVSSFAPLGAFDTGGCFGTGGSLWGSRIDDFVSQATRNSISVPDSVRDLFDLAAFTDQNWAVANQNLQTAFSTSRV